MARKLQEDQMVKVVRNALLVAGQEMGNGDQWPVVKDTIERLDKDWEEYKIRKNVKAELHTHLYEKIGKIQSGLHRCSPEMQVELGAKLAEFREVCDAFFSDLDAGAVVYSEDDEPPHVRRMKEILGILEADA